LRHYIPVLARRSRCFCRKLETLQAIVEVFVDAYNKFGEAKLKHRIPTTHKTGNDRKHLHKYRETPFCILDFYNMRSFVRTCGYVTVDKIQ